MNSLQSVDFNAGIIYSEIRKIAMNMITSVDSISTSSYARLPAIQVFPGELLYIPNPKARTVAAIDKDRIIAEIEYTIMKQFNAVYGNHLTLLFDAWNHEKQYVIISFTISKKEKCKEMTIEDIEKALGYKVKIIGKTEN